MGATLDEVSGLVTEAITRLKASEENSKNFTTEEKVKLLAKEMLTELLTDPTGETATKLKQIWSANQPDARLKGSKFARYGMTVPHIELLYDVLEAGKIAGRSTGPSEDLRNAFNDLSGAYFISTEEAKAKGLRDVEGMFQRYYGTPNLWTDDAKRSYEASVKALDTAESGYGNQLIGAQYVGDLWPAARRLGRLFPLIDTFEMTSPTSYLPVEADLPEMLFVGESTSPTATAYTTSKAGSNRVQVDAKKFVVSMIWSTELEEDSIIPLIDYLLAQARKSVAHYADSLVLNGDTTDAGTGNINLDDANPADTKHYLAFDGIRHVYLVDTTANGVDSAGAMTWNKLQNLKGLMIHAAHMIDWGQPADPEDVIYTCDPQSSLEIQKLPELTTFNNYGPNATVLNGEVAKVGRNPLIPTIAMSKTEADGFVSTTAGNNTLGQVACFNRRGFKAGWRRQVRVETKREVETDQNRIFFSLRMGFGRYSSTGAASGIESAAGLYNITLNT